MKTFYSKQGLWTLFLMCALVPHLWALILIARDMSWVAERSNAWDAVGTAAYGLAFTLVESLLLFIIVCMLGLLTPRTWSSERRIAFLSILALTGLLWAVIGQLGFLAGFNPPAAALRWLAEGGHPVRVMYILALILVVPSVLLPALWVARSDGGLKTFRQIMDRLSPLAVFYLVFDLLGLVVLFIRNIG